MTSVRSRLTTLASALVVVVVLGGCSTHDERFSNVSAPQKPESPGLEVASDRLLEQGSRLRVRASAAALVDYTEAAAWHYEATESPRSRKLLPTFADGLLNAQVVANGSKGIRLSASRETSRTGTLRAGLALLTAYEVTGNQRYANIARAYARLVPTADFGWHDVGRASAVRATDRTGDSIVATALAGAFLAESARVLKTDTRDDARRAIRLVRDEQVAVGRWYTHTGWKRSMNLDEWATTLYALIRSGDEEAVGYVGGGVPALRKAAFTPAGAPAKEGIVINQVGIGHSLALLGTHMNRQLSEPVFRAALAASENFSKPGTNDIDALAAAARGVAAGLLAESQRLAQQ